MTRLLVEDLLSEGPALIQEAMSILAASEDDRVRMLTSYLPSIADDPWRMVATGEYNAGKSTLLKALTGDPRIKIDSDIATEEATEYTWNHILLVDTPGVAAGRDLHDERAEAALRDADLVLFVLTVALFDDVTEQHFRHVAHELGKLRQMIVVINKSTQMAAVPGVRADAVQEALGDTHQMPPIVECDGLAMLRAETEADPERRDFEENRSGRAAFLGTLNAFVRAEGTAGRLRKPFDAILALVNDARPLLEPDEAEAALSSLLDRRRESVAVSRLRVVNALEAVYGSTTDAILAAGEAVIVSAQDGVPQSTAVDAFDRAAKGAAEALEEKVKRVFANELVNLQADERGLIAGPEMQILDALSARDYLRSLESGVSSAVGLRQ